MNRLMLLLVLVLLAGCGGPRLLNPGAAVPIYLAPRADLVAEYLRRGGTYAPNQTCQSGFYDRERKDIWIAQTGRATDPIRAVLHEVLMHFVEDQGGDAHTALARLSCPAFDLMYSDAPAETQAASAALRAAHARTP